LKNEQNIQIIEVFEKIKRNFGVMSKLSQTGGFIKFSMEAGQAQQFSQ